MVFAAFLLGFVLPATYFYVALTAVKFISNEPSPPMRFLHWRICGGPWDGRDGGADVSPEFIELH